MPLLVEKFRANLQTRFPAQQCDAIMDSCGSLGRLEVMQVHEFVSQL